MNKAAIKNFAVWARQKLIDDITYKAGTLGITENGIAEKLPQSTNDLHFFDIGTKNYAEVSGKDIEKRSALVSAVKSKDREINNYKEAFQYIVEGVAYTWFNRLIAIRFMEVNNYLPSGVRVLSSENKAKIEPDFVTVPFDTDLEFTPFEQDRIIQLKDENKLDELFRMLFIKQCNELHDILPELFEKTDDYTELLLTISFTDKDGIVYRLTHDIDEDDFNVEKEGQAEIIGWMYQYYNIEPKAEVFARKIGTKIKKEEIPAATQLFTPDWIVRYMVENSLGRLWVEGHPSDNLKDSWNYYIDEAEQEPEVLAKLEEIRTSYKGLTPEKIKVIDPCMGSGHILVYAFDVLMQIYESYGYTQRDAARSILQNNIYGLDIDERAYQLAYFAVMMKARQYNRRILTESIEPNFCFIKNSKILQDSTLDKMGEYKKVTLQLINEFRYAVEYGSIMSVSLSETDLQNISNQLKSVKNSEDIGNLMDIMDCNELVSVLRPLLKQAKILKQKYEVVITNPPYLSGSAVGSKLNDYLKANYPASKTDLFAVFIERCAKMLKNNGLQAMITMHSWMFLSSYEKLREKMLHNDTVNMVHLGARAFEEIGGEVVQTTAFIRRNSHTLNYKGVYCRLIEPNTQQGKEDMFLSGEKRYKAEQKNFSKIPGSPVAYWVSEKILSTFSNTSLKDIIHPKQGTSTGDDYTYVRFWHEINYIKFSDKQSCLEVALESGFSYFPLNKGGEYRKWYGNNDKIIKFNKPAYNALLLIGNHLPSRNMYFKRGLTWSKITSNRCSFRLDDIGFVFSSVGLKGFPNQSDEIYTLCLLNSVLTDYYLQIISPGLSTVSGDIEKLPYIKGRENTSIINQIGADCVHLSRTDWDSFETSWDFKRHPLLNGDTVAKAFDNWKAECENRFNQLKANEEELNRIFIDIYGLQDELTPEVADKDVTVRKADLQRDIKSLLSYAVGCMFGRYSLDCEGLVFAGGNFNDVFIEESLYPSNTLYPSNNLFPKAPEYTKLITDNGDITLSFYPDYDNCIPITDEEYFENDIVGLLCNWLKAVYGEKTLEENLDLIAKTLGNKGSTSREIIRNYFLNDFIKDHIKTYQKRPIYWLFDSGKQNGFKALCYMHRYDADTIGNMRVEYLHRMQRVYDKEIERMQEVIDNSRDSKEISQAGKRKEKLQKQIKEAKDYDSKVAHLALSRIDIDLDDGVKVNYEKVQTGSDGKKVQILTKF